MKKPVALLFIMAVGALALGLAIGRARANPGELDPTWGEEGVRRFAFSENGDWVTAALLDPDGKVVISGWVDGYPGSFGVARFRPDGTSDTTFGDEGKVITRFSTDPELPNSSWSIGPRPDGGYLVAGEICDADYVICEWVAAAYNHDGTLDETFDDDGWITTTVPGAEGVYAWPPTNLLQPDGKSIVGGIVFDSEGDIDFALRRYNSDGSLDDTFGDGGIAVHDLSDKGDYTEYLALLPDGKILVLGGMGAVIDPFTYEGEGGFLARLNDDGSIDDTFGTDGVVTWGDDGVFTATEGLAVSADGEIYVSGQRGEGADGTFDCAVWHFDAGGAMDETFGDGGLLLIDDGGDEWCVTVNFLPDGKLALTGNIYPLEAERSSAGRIRERGAMGSRSSLGGDSPKVGNTPDALVIRLNPDGTLDETFGDGGLLNHDVEEKDNDGTIAVIQPDGKILIAANVYDVETEYQDIAISRFLGSAVGYPGAHDPTWGDGGISYAGSDEADDYAYSQVMLPDGSLIAGGWANVYPGDFGAARFLPNGHLDPDFGDDGLVTTAFTADPEAVDAAYGINSRPGGGFHLFGETCDADYAVCQLAAAAYLPDGSLDPSFGEDGRVVTDPGTESALSWSTRNVLQPDGKLVTAGVVFLEDGRTDLILIRYNVDGSLDDTFGDGGMVIQDFMGLSTYPQDLMALPGDELLATGSMAETTEEGEIVAIWSFIARFDSNGDLVTSFGGGDGYVLWDHNGGFHAAQRALLLPDGKILVIGATEEELQNFSPVDCTIQRFDMEGNMDETFGDEGWVIFDSGQSDYCWDVKLTGDGKLVIAGQAQPATDPELRGAFGRVPRAGSARAGGYSAAANRAMPRDGHFDNIIGRFYLDGTPDASFGDDGLVRFRVNEEPAFIYGVDIQPSGKYVVAGEAMLGDFSQMVALRFLGDGAVERVFLPIVVGRQPIAAVNLEDAAIQAVARRQGIPAARLAIANTATAEYAVSGVTAQAFKVEDTTTGDLYNVMLDAAGNILDEAGLDAAEVAAYRARYGALEQSLAELIESGVAPESLPLVIWLKEPEYVAPARADADSSATPRSAAEMDAFLAMVDTRRADAVAAVSAPVLSRMSGMGLSAEGDRFAPVVYARLSQAQLAQLAEWPEVDRVYLDVVNQPTLNIARQVIGANTVNARGYSGSGVRVAQVEVGGRVATGNPYLSGVVQDGTYVCSYLNSHATGVAGIIRSTHSTNRGVAPSALLWAGGSCTGNNSQLSNRSTAAVSWGARVLNLSFGSDPGRVVGASSLDRYYDNLSMTSFRTIVVANGNNASPCAPGNGNTLSPALAYNIIAVGNFYDQNSLSWTGDTFSGTCSSFVDPISTKSDREKPEVAAPGTSIVSTINASPWTGNIGSGTSYAAPMVTGTVALMMQRHTSLQSWPEVVKAILMATATHNIEGSARLSEYDGAGAILADRADDVSRGANGGWAGRSYSCSTATNYDVITMALTAGVRTRVVITWNNPSTYASYTTKPSADLDLLILNPSGQGVTGSASWDNNYEIVDFTPSVSGTYKVRVRKIRCDASPAYLGVAWARG